MVGMSDPPATPDQEDWRMEIVDCRLSLNKPLAFKQGKISNLPSNINNKSTIHNLKSQAPVFQAGVNLQSTIGNLQSVDTVHWLKVVFVVLM
jgi:hypothetical protein